MTRDAMIEKLTAAFDLGWDAHRVYLLAPRPDCSTKSERRTTALASVLAALRSRPVPPDDLVRAVEAVLDHDDTHDTLHGTGLAEMLRAALASPAPVAVGVPEGATKHLAPVAAPAPAALARWLRRTKPQPEEWRSRDGELPQMGGGSAGYLDALQSWNEARESAGLPHGFDANIDAFLRQKVAAPAPETPAPDAMPAKCSACGASVELCLEYALTALGSTTKCCEQCDHGRRQEAQP